MFKHSVVAAASVAVLALAPVAQAAPITGGISFSSVSVGPGLSPVIPVGPTGSRLDSFLDATGLDFTTSGESTPGIAGAIGVNGTSGDFNQLYGVVGTIQDFSFLGAGLGNFPAPPIDDFEHLVHAMGSPVFSFDLLTVGVRTQTENLLTLTGTGLFHLTGYEATAGSFFFSTNEAGATLSYSVSEATPVPEPMSLLLLGSGLLGLSAVRRRMAK